MRSLCPIRNTPLASRASSVLLHWLNLQPEVDIRPWFATHTSFLVRCNEKRVSCSYRTELTTGAMAHYVMRRSNVLPALGTLKVFVKDTG